MSLAIAAPVRRARTDRGESKESREVLETVTANPIDTAVSFENTGSLLALLDACGRASIPGWDGAGSQPVSLATYRNARRFAEAIPAWATTPEVAVYPDGTLEFEWHGGARRVFAASVGASDIIHFAGLYGIEAGQGRLRFLDEFPPLFEEWISRVCRAHRR